MVRFGIMACVEKHEHGSDASMSAAVVRAGEPSSAFLFLGAAVAGFYVVAQLFQQLVFRFVLPEAPDAAAEIALRLVSGEIARQVVVLTSLFLTPVAYAALAAARWRHAPAAAVVGVLFGLFFAALESSYRSIDLFAAGQWATEFVAAGDGARRALLLERFVLWDAVVISLYLPLLAAHALASAAFAVAVGAGTKQDWWDRVLMLALVANAIRAVLRIMQMHAGVEWLAPFNSVLYLPVTLLTYGTLSAWLARLGVQRKRSELEPLTAQPGDDAASRSSVKRRIRSGSW